MLIVKPRGDVPFISARFGLSLLVTEGKDVRHVECQGSGPPPVVIWANEEWSGNKIAQEIPYTGDLALYVRQIETALNAEAACRPKQVGRDVRVDAAQTKDDVPKEPAPRPEIPVAPTPHKPQQPDAPVAVDTHGSRAARIGKYVGGGALLVSAAALSMWVADKPSEPTPRPPVKHEENKSKASGATAVINPPPGKISDRLIPILEAAYDRKWQVADREIAALKRAATSPAPGNRRLARSLNDEGDQALQAKDYAKAIRHLKDAVAADPSDAEIHNNLAFAHLRQGQIEEADRHVQMSLTMAPDDALAWANMAEISSYYKELNPEEGAIAKAALRLAVHLSPNPTQTLDHLRARMVGSNPFAETIRGVLPTVEQVRIKPSK